MKAELLHLLSDAAPSPHKKPSMKKRHTQTKSRKKR
jgi:hypothetical protein